MRQRTPICALLLASILWLSAGATVRAADSPAGSDRLELVSVQRLWANAPHCAFTSLIRCQGKWYCAFREADSHEVGPAFVRILTSADGVDWQSLAKVGEASFDLRDPHLSVTPQGDMMLLASRAVQPSDTASRRFQSVVRFSEDGRDWSEPIEVGDPAFWLWSASWHQGHCYAFGYDYANRSQLRLYHSEDGGHSFQTLIDDVGDRHYPNESSIAFDREQTAYCLLRRGGPARFGKSLPPYTEWEWMDTGIGIGGPALIQLPDRRWLAGGRGSKDGARTLLWYVDPASGTLTEAAVLPSGGDTSYPGLVWHHDALWVSYYSSHEGKSSIYLAKLRLHDAS